MVIRVREQTGHIDFSPLQMHWQALEQLTDDVERLDSQPPSSVLTRRLIDEGQIAGRRVTFAAQRYLRMANEHHEALQSQLEHFGVRHWTHWSLLRPQFEASFWVLWLLDPDEGAERRRRGLRCEATDAKACARWLDSQVGAGLDAELVAEAKQTNFAASHNTYRAEATQLNLSPSRLYNPVNVVDELPKLQGSSESRV